MLDATEVAKDATVLTSSEIVGDNLRFLLDSVTTDSSSIYSSPEYENESKFTSTLSTYFKVVPDIISRMQYSSPESELSDSLSLREDALWYCVCIPVKENLQDGGWKLFI